MDKDVWSALFLGAHEYGLPHWGEKPNLGEEMADVLWVLICLANQTGVDLTEELQKSLEKKTQRDHDRHRNNPKLKSASTPPDNGQETDKE